MSSVAQAPSNGVDVDQLVQTISAVESDPDLARFQFRVRTEWLSGGHSRSKIQGFFGAGEEDTSRTEPFVVEGDEPSVLLGSNEAPNAVEAVLHALTSCLAVGLAYNAAARGITIRSIEFEADGDLDLHGFLGLSESVRAGFEGIQLRCTIDADASGEDLSSLWAHVQRTSPVLDILTNPVPVQLELEG